MHKLSTYIEFTLMTRHYVFVPGIGGFLLRDIDASYTNHKYYPSHKEIHFNRFLTKDDGMLANAYMLAEGISYDEAISQIQIEVASIKSIIEKRKSYQLGNLGILSYDSDHHLVVKNPKHFPIDPESYGLNAFSIKPWIENEQLKKNKSNQADIISIPKYWLQRAAAVVILLICYFANNSFITEQGSRVSDYANVFDADILFGNVAPNINNSRTWDATWENEVVLANLESAVDSTVHATEVVKTNTQSDAASNIVTQNVFNNTSIPANPGKLYYVIIASCTSLDEAEHAVRNRQKAGYENIGILARDGRYRLYLKSFTDRTEGEKYLETVRTTTPFQSAWLLPVRQESLISYILKNFDNDQLPMELSHPYQRTERDKGWINT